MSACWLRYEPSVPMLAQWSVVGANHAHRNDQSGGGTQKATARCECVCLRGRISPARYKKKTIEDNGVIKG